MDNGISLGQTLNSENQDFAIGITGKPVYNGHLWDHKIVAVLDRWSLFKGNFKL